jgi:hypothetical protein
MVKMVEVVETVEIVKKAEIVETVKKEEHGGDGQEVELVERLKKWRC